MLFILSFNKSFRLIVPSFHYFSATFPPQLRHLSYRVTNTSVARCYQPASCVGSHRVSAVSTSRWSLKLWSPRSCFVCKDGYSLNIVSGLHAECSNVVSLRNYIHRELIFLHILFILCHIFMLTLSLNFWNVTDIQQVFAKAPNFTDPFK